MSAVERVAGTIVYRVDNGRVLFLLLEKSNGEYDIPKGHLEGKETDEQGAVRETFEETGIKPVFVPFYSDSTDYGFMENGKRIDKHLALFLAEVSGDKVIVSHEHKGYSWEEYDNAIKKIKHRNMMEIMSRVFEYIRRWKEMQRLNQRYARIPDGVEGWDLSKTLVPGEGRLDSGLMVLGQAPGANEDIQRRPFIGRSGKLLDSVLGSAGIGRGDVYITSTVQFFPPKNRIPSDDETELCRPFLKAQIEIVKPKYMILLGNVASKAMLGVGEVTKAHGTIVKRDGIEYMITFHPAAALRFKRNVALMESDMKTFAKAMHSKAD